MQVSTTITFPSLAKQVSPPMDRELNTLGNRAIVMGLNRTFRDASTWIHEAC